MTKNKLFEKYRKFGDLREAGKIEEAIEGYEGLMKEAEKELFAEVPQMLGVAYRMQKKSEKGLRFAKLAVEWAIKAGDGEMEANARRDLGEIYKDLDKLEMAESEYDKSLRLMWKEVAGKMSGLAGTLAFKGGLAMVKKDYNQAHELINAAIAMLYPQVMLDSTEAGQYYLFVLHKAEVCKAEGKIEEAKELARKALRGFKQLNQKQAVRMERAERLIISLGIGA